MRVYLAGPMRGYADFNFPAFHDATRQLRAAGYEVHSPAEEDGKNGFDPAGMNGHDHELTAVGFDTRKALCADLTFICLHSEAVVVLPGWERSLGAQAEVRTAHAIGVPVLELCEALVTDSGEDR